ncbi:MAG: FRG domain-containing protein [Alphaproteobacteria bacterium]
MIKSIEEFIKAVREDSFSWPDHQPKWFRGEPTSDDALVPTLYRCGFAPHENPLLQMFRARASGFYDEVPDREKTDQWLFLARHVGLPTRLLDWSESALVGLYFALIEKETPAVVWMLNPLQLNHFAAGAPADQDPNKLREFPLPWFRPQTPRVNIAFENIRGAWELDGPGVPLPVAVHPTYVHSRLRAQGACFTIHGKQKEGLDRLVPDSILKWYQIDPASHGSMLRDLQLLGVTESVVFPDLDGLATELKNRFSRDDVY